MLSELKNYRQWVIHRSDKVPLNPHTGQLVSNANPLDWSDFTTAWNICNQHSEFGLGFVLTDNDPYSVIDFDDATDPKHNHTEEELIEIAAIQQKIAADFDSYSEISPSGKGLHTWVKGSLPSGKRDSSKHIEVYSSGRYMTVTFNVFNNVPIQDRSELLQQLWEYLGGVEQSPVQITSQIATASDDEICRLCASGTNGNGDMFTELWKGNWEPYFPSQSEADLTFCNIVAFYTDNTEQVGRIYWSSPLFLNSLKRKRKAKHDYLFHESWGLVTKAFDRKGPVVDFSELIAKGKEQLQRENDRNNNNTPVVSNVLADSSLHGSLPMEASIVDSSSIEDDLEEDEVDKTQWLQPPGLLGEIASFIYFNAVNPVVEVSVAAAIAYTAGIAGRGYNYSRTGLNQYVVLLANTSGGKEGAAQGMSKLTHAVRELVPAFERFMGPSDIASPQALIKQLVETPCFMSHKDEFGMWLQKLTGKYAKANETQLRGMLLALFGKSGAKETLRGSIYSDRQKNVPSIDSPALTLFGDSTQQEFYRALDEDAITEGFVPRLTVIESSGARPQYNEWNNSSPPKPELVHKLASLGKRCLELELLKAPIHVRETPDALAYHKQFREYCTDQVYRDLDSPIAQIWSRAHLRTIRLAALAAVGVNIDNPIITMEELLWAEQVVRHGVKTVQRRYEMGKLGAINFELEQRTSVGRMLRKFARPDAYNSNWEKAYGINREMHKARIVTNRYIQNNVNNLMCFRNDRNPKLAYRCCINDLVDNGYLQKVDMASLKKAGKHGVAYYILDLAGLPH